MVRAAEVFGEGYGDLGFADAGGTDEEERTFWAIRMRQIQFPTLENRADTREDMVLSFDVGFEVVLQIAELVENRNAIAHGRRTADEVGSGFSYEDMKQRINDIEKISLYLLNQMENHYINGGILR